MCITWNVSKGQNQWQSYKPLNILSHCSKWFFSFLVLGHLPGNAGTARMWLLRDSRFGGHRGHHRAPSIQLEVSRLQPTGLPPWRLKLHAFQTKGGTRIAAGFQKVLPLLNLNNQFLFSFLHIYHKNKLLHNVRNTEFGRKTVKDIIVPTVLSEIQLLKFPH